MGGYENISRAGPRPKVLHPTPTHLSQPMQPPELLHVPGAGPTHVWQGCLELVLPHSGCQLVTFQGQCLNRLQQVHETQRVALPSGITASAGRLESSATVPQLTESLPDFASGISITAPSVPVVATEPTHLIHPESPGLERKRERGILAVWAHRSL